MCSISSQMSFCGLKNSGQESNRQKIELGYLRQEYSVVLSSDEKNGQVIRTKKQLEGMIVEGVEYKQTVVVRSYEVGPHSTATLETILNLLQETSLSQAWMSGHLSGFGTTHGMSRRDLIWVVSRMQLQVEHFPLWGEAMEIDTWLRESGKNGIERNWLLRSRVTGLVLARTTSTWVMMNQKTRCLSKIPDEVRAEISPWFDDKPAIQEEQSLEKIHKLDSNERYVRSNLKAKRSDLDMNLHINNVEYVKWMLESIPEEFLEKHQICSIVLEYRRECGELDVVQSLCEPHEDGLSFTHLLQKWGDTNYEEIVRGKSIWKKFTPYLELGKNRSS